MSLQEIPPEFDELLNQFLEDELSADEFAAFEKTLRENPQARNYYFDVLDVNSGIARNRTNRLRELDRVILQGIKAPQPSQETATSPTRRSGGRAVAFLLVAAASVSVLLLTEWIMTGHFFWNQPEQVVQPDNKASEDAT
ncbi:MAG: hypothetical protein RLO18_31365, partial [Gimesia chilikensis]